MQFCWCELLKIKAPGPRSLGEVAHFLEPVFAENEPDMPGRAKLDVPPQHFSCLSPKCQRTPGEGKLGQVTAAAANIAEGGDGRAAADPVSLDHRYPQAAPGEKIGRCGPHQAASQNDHIHEAASIVSSMPFTISGAANAVKVELLGLP